MRPRSRNRAPLGTNGDKTLNSSVEARVCSLHAGVREPPVPPGGADSDSRGLPSPLVSTAAADEA